MAIWKEIGKALNSTIFTGEFKPLDKIIRDSYYVYASDDVLKVAYNDDPSSNTIDLTTVGTMGVSGTINFHLEIEGELYSDSQLKIYIGDGEDLKVIERDIESDLLPMDVLVEVKKGDKIQFSVKFGTYSRINNLYITINGKVSAAPDTGIFIE